MTLEERVSRTVNRLAVIERILPLEGLEAANHYEPRNEAALKAGMRELIEEAYEDLEPIGRAPFEITSWEPDQTETA